MESDFIEVYSPDEIASFEKSIQLSIASIQKDRRVQGPIPPNEEQLSKTYDGCIFAKSRVDLLTLILLCWYSNTFGDFYEYILYEVNLYLESNRLFPIMSAMTYMRSCCTYLLMNLMKVHPRVLYGSILEPSRVERVIRTTRLRWITPRKPKRVIRHRGYRDHGTLRPRDRWLETSDYSFTEEQNLKEEKQQEYLDQVAYFVRLAGDWVIRNQLQNKK
jgi:hypothetical protein